MPSLPFTGPHLVQSDQEFAKTNTLTFTAN